MAIRWIDDPSVSFKGKRVFCRVDFNVPLTDDGRIADDERIRAALPTIELLVQKGARLLLASHLGRPKGKAKKSLSLEPVAEHLQKLLGRELIFADDCVGDGVRHLAKGLEDGQILLLETLRVHAGEENNDEGFAKQLAENAEVYVSDAFGAVHRAHASTVGMIPFMEQAYGGLLLRSEVEALSSLLKAPDKPFVAILGGAKVSDKLAVLNRLLDRVNTMIIGGAMAYTFLKAKGEEIGASRYEEDRLNIARSILDKAGHRLLLPVDHVAATSFAEDAPHRIVEAGRFTPEEMGLDIGPATRKRFAEAIAGAGTVFWNGPMGVFEWDAFAAGTMAVMEAVARSHAFSVVGGGDSVAAVNKGGMHDRIRHVSTGGGASLELLEGKTLPGLRALGYEL